MCEPVSLTMAGLAIAGSAAGYASQADASRKQGHYQNDMYEQNAQSAISDLNQKNAALNVRSVQEQESLVQQAMANQQEGEAAKSQVNTVTAANGVEGATVDQLLADFDRQEAMANEDLGTNTNWHTQQLKMEREGYAAEAQSRINGATPQPVAMPSALAATINGASGVMGAYDTHLRASKSGPYGDTPSWWYTPLWGKTNRSNTSNQVTIGTGG